MPVPAELKTLCDAFFVANSDVYDLTTKEGCGQYMEALVVEARDKGWEEVGHLRKYGSQTQYNGHAVDALAYDLGNDLTHAVDCIGNAEAKPPYSSSHQPPKANFGEDTQTAYSTSADWYVIEGNGGGGSVDKVPWLPYDENSFQSLKSLLAFDYGRRPQAADFDVSVWAARVFHSAYMGPEKTPLGLERAMLKHRPEWCAALGVPVVPPPSPKG